MAENFDFEIRLGADNNIRMSIRVAILGPTGYTGLHLIEILLSHPEARLTYLGSQREELPDITRVFPRLRGRVDSGVAVCRPIDPSAIARQADVVFLALPHGASLAVAPRFLEAGLRVIDLSADYRLKDLEVYAATYEKPHGDPRNLARAVYGLPEFFRQEIGSATLVANPGCYPTAAALAIGPLLKQGLVRDDSVVVNAASGVTGAGRSPAPHLHFPEQNEAFGPYGKIGSHRHQPEIEQTLSWVCQRKIRVLIVPHLLPIDQGILETIYLEPAHEGLTDADVLEALRGSYHDQPFVRVVDDLPNVKHVVGTNFCDVTARVVGPKDQRRVVVFSALDNMIKGASGQAVQNMNLMFGLEETTGLL